MFLACAVGSMGVRSPGDESGFEKARAIGEGLAKHVLENAQGVALKEELEIASLGVPLELPSLQMRLNPSWRLSPFVFGMLGLDSDGWLQCVRVGDTYLLGTPCDFSGEISLRLQEWGASHGADLWPLSFNGDYVGYISPDEYYATAEKEGTEGYEMYLMSWCGPNQEAFFTHLAKEAVEALSRPTRAGS